MKLAVTSRGVETNLEAPKAFAMGDPRKLFAILADKIYSDKPRAVIREYTCNALDIHTRIGQTKPFFVSLPSALDPSFSVRDFGTGLRDELIETLFCTFFASDKADSNAELGGFGLGSKAGFAYTDAFTVTSFQAGRKSIYAMFRGDDGVPAVSLVGVEDTDEDDGLEVKIPVNRADYATFEARAQDILRWFPEGSYQLFGARVTPMKINVRTETYLEVPRENYNYVLMGPVAYQVDWSHMDVELPRSIVPIFNVGDLDLPPSREQLSYDPQTIKTLKARYDDIMRELPAKALEVAETMTPRQRIEFKDSLANGGLHTLFDNYHKAMGHRAEDGAAREAARTADQLFGFQPTWGTYLLKKHERFEIPGDIITYDKASSRSSKRMHPSASHDAKMELNYLAEFQKSRAFFLMDVTDRVPRTYARLEDSGVDANIYHVVRDLAPYQEHFPDAGFYKLSDFEAPPSARYTKNINHFYSGAGSNGFHEREGQLPESGLYIPYEGKSQEDRPGQFTWDNLMSLPLLKQQEVVGLNKSARQKLDMSEFQLIDAWVKAEVANYLQDPVVLRSLAADEISTQAREFPISKFVSERAQHGQVDLLPKACAAALALQADRTATPQAVLETIRTMARWGMVKLPKVKDYHKVLPALAQATKRNPVLMLIISHDRDYSAEIFQRIVK